MAQSALTVTTANPTPPTNYIFVGNTPPLDPAQAVVDDGIAAAVPNAKLLTPANAHTLNEIGTVTTWPTSITFNTSTAAANTAGAPGANISNTHEARGTETASAISATVPSTNPLVAIGTTTPAQNLTVGVGPAATAATRAAGPNQSHASSLSPATPLTQTTTGATGASNVSGSGYTTLTVTGTNYDRTSTVYLNGVAQITNYVSATSLTVTNALKRTTAGTLPVYVISGSSGVQTATVNWTLT
jgi:hypothetical protein